MSWLDDELRRRNQMTQDHWVQFAAHRQRVTGLLLEACALSPIGWGFWRRKLQRS